MELVVKKEDAHCGKDILALLKSMSLSSKMIKYLKYREDGITVNGSRVTVRYVLKDNDVLSLAIDDSESADCTPTDVDLDIIYEDNDLIVVNKPPFMPTHTSHGHYDDTLANALAGYFSGKGFPFVFRPINRLDRNTSGLVLVAKNKPSASFLSAEMRAHRICKVYLAVLNGELPDPTETSETPYGEMGIVNKPLHRTAASIIVREVCSEDAPDAESAVTLYRILGRKNGLTLVEAHPKTGRTHQLRVHFAHLGCPILGDDIYGSPSDLINRHALHALSLSLSLPPDLLSPSEKENHTINLRAEPPADMAGLVSLFFK